MEKSGPRRRATSHADGIVNNVISVAVGIPIGVFKANAIAAAMSEIRLHMQEMHFAPRVEQQSALTVVVVGTIGRASLGSARAANLHGRMLEAAKAALVPQGRLLRASRKVT